jgi:hypothetical protein
MKPRVLFISNRGETHPWVRRLNKRGIPTNIYIHDLGHRSAYANVHPRLGLDGLMDSLKSAETVVVDTIARNNKTDRDFALLDKFGVSHNSLDLFGPISDKLKRPPYSIPNVIGGGEEAADYELNREKGMELAKKAGLEIPEYEKFSSIKAGIKFLQGPGKGHKWVAKPNGNIDLDLTYPEDFEGELVDFLTHVLPRRVGNGDQVDFILQKFVANPDGTPGVEVSSELWCTGKEKKLLHPNRTLEDKKLYSRVTGPRVGSQVNLVWLCKDAEGPVHKGMTNLLDLLAAIDYWGALDFNCIFTIDGKIYHLEPTWRVGYSALWLFLTFLLPGSLANFVLNPFDAVWQNKGRGFVASQVLSLHPFPTKHREDLQKKIAGNLINHSIDMKDVWWTDVYVDDAGNLRVNGADGLVAVVTCYDKNREMAIRKTYQKVSTLKVAGDKQFWPLQEHLESHLGRLNKLRRWGINVF